MYSKTRTIKTNTTEIRAPRSTKLRNLRHGALVLGLCASLGAGALSLGGTADARIRDIERVGTFAETCGEIQDQYDQIHDEYMKSTDTNEDERLMRLMDAAEANWIEYGCDGAFGSIRARTLTTTTLPDTVKAGAINLSGPTAGPTTKVAPPMSAASNSRRLTR